MTTPVLSAPRAIAVAMPQEREHQCEYRKALTAIVFGPEPPMVTFNAASELLCGRRWDDEMDLDERWES